MRSLFTFLFLAVTTVGIAQKQDKTRYRYYPNGKLYVYESFLGISEFLEPQFLIISHFDSLGNALITDGNGHFKGFDKSFTKIIEEGDIKNGKKAGKWSFKDSLDSRVEIYNDNGEFITGTITKNTGEVRSYLIKEELPLFDGGQKGFIKYLNRNLKYPKNDRKNRIQGRVKVQFTVEKDGTLSNITILEHVSPDIDNEAIRVFQNSPKWKPAMQYGFPVTAKYTTPISFSLP